MFLYATFALDAQFLWGSGRLGVAIQIGMHIKKKCDAPN